MLRSVASEQDLDPRPTDHKPKCLTRYTTVPHDILDVDVGLDVVASNTPASISMVIFQGGWAGQPPTVFFHNRTLGGKWQGILYELRYPSCHATDSVKALKEQLRSTSDKKLAEYYI